jgi:PAS domain S-box-containing protein
MQTGQQELWKKKHEKLKDENRLLREKLNDLRRENNKLQKSLKNNNRLLHAIPSGIVLIQDGKVVEINALGLREFGYSAEEIIGRGFLDFVRPGSKPSVRGLLRRGFTRSQPDQYEAELVGKSGETLGFDVMVKRIRFNGRTAFILDLNRNEKRKQREKELIAAKKREALITMASGITRELDQSIKGITKRIEEGKGLVDSKNKALMEGLGRIESAAGEIKQTAQRLESLSRTRNEPSNIVPFDLKKVVKRAVSLTNPRLNELTERQNVTINLRTYLRSVSPVEGDPEEIQDVIMSLILNAVEAMPKGGDLYLTTEENAEYAHVYVQDSGVGIPDAVKDRIMDPFHTTKGKDCVGLGLSLSHAIIQRHKGEIEITSQKDQGTIFTIRLPLAKRPESKPPAKRKTKNAHILIIEDEGIIGDLLSQVLAGKGHRIVTCVNGSQAVNRLKRKSYDLVIADLQASNLGGHPFVKEAKRLKPELPIALIAAQKDVEGFNHSERTDADLVITKPIDVNKVVNQVSDMLRLRS